MDVRHQPLPLQSRRSRLALPLAGERVAAGFPSPADDYVGGGNEPVKNKKQTRPNRSIKC